VANTDRREASTIEDHPMANNRLHSLLRAATSATKNNREAKNRSKWLQLEHLESRDVPSVAANDVYISSLYQGLLGRNSDPGGLAFWDSQLNAGQSRTQVALGIEKSDEFIGRAVQIYYQDFLGRPGDSAGVNFWVNAARQGESLEHIKASILGSDEFFTHTGNTLNTYINAIYESQLGRAVDSAGLSFWSRTTTNTADGRAETALQIMHSAEGEQVKVTGYYELLLGRLPGASEVNFWVGDIHSGAQDSDVIAGILGSPEYYGQVQFFAASGTDANSAAHTFIVTTHRFSGTRPGAEELNATIATDPSLVLPPPAGNGKHGHHFTTGPSVSVGFFGGTGPFFTTGSVVGVGTGHSGGFSGGGFSGGGGFGGGGFSGGGFSGGGSSGGGSGGGSGSLRAAVPHDRIPNGGMDALGGRGKGAGLYLTGGMLTLAGTTDSGIKGQAPTSPLGSDSSAWQRPFNTLAQLQALEATLPPVTSLGAGQLTEQQLQATVSAALVRLEQAGISQSLLARLESATYEVGNLPGPLLGYTFTRDHTVVIDATADGYGWYVNPTSQTDSAFTRSASAILTANPDSPAAGHMDLLTTVLHEMGHLAGFGDVSPQAHPNNLMDTTLPTGVRRTDALDAIFTRGFV